MAEITDDSDRQVRVAITGGTGFVGAALARELLKGGHEVVLIARRARPDLPTGAALAPAGLSDPGALRRAFDGSDAVAHLAGINRERGQQTYQAVHVEGTAKVVAAARDAGVKRIAMLSFLRARPGCDSPYHESKFQAEQIVRAGGIPYTILKSGVIYGRGDHLLDHLSHALYTLPLFATVGWRQPPLRPTAVRDVVRMLRHSLLTNGLENRTLAVVGPQELTMAQLVQRVAGVIGRRARVVPMPVAFHKLLAALAEATMGVPLVSRAQVRMLAEGLCEPTGDVDPLPDELRPTTPFTDDAIRAGLPPAGPFTCAHLRLRLHRGGNMTTSADVHPTSGAPRGTIYYDGECNLCTGSASRFGPMLRRRGFQLAPLQTPDVASRLGIAPDELLDEVRLQTSDGQTFGGADAILFVAKHVWWATPLWAMSLIPGVRPLLRWLYRRLVPYRYCDGGRCGRPSPLVTWAPAVALPAGALALRPLLQSWAFMWLMAAAVFYAAKWVTWRQAQPALRAHRARSLGYLLAWPGMDADEFLRRDTPAPAALAHDWLKPLLSAGAGAALIWILPRFVAQHGTLLAGWVGMIGMILLLHCGLFALLALLWQSAGVNARPIMNRATTSASVSEFWGRRWNRGFSDLMRQNVFEPLRRRAGLTAALVTVFLVSGLIHESVITLAARGGWGGPTLYFLIQAGAILIERTRAARRTGLGRGVRGWAFVALVTIAPLPLLFPPVFVERVIVPFMHAIGAFDAIGAIGAIESDRATLIRIAGLLHFGILLASALVPRVLDWRRELAKLEPLTRHLVWVHGAFIVLAIVGFGAIATVHAHELARGSMLARSFCSLIAIFWLARLGIQFFVFDARPYLTTLPLKLGYHGLTVVFSMLVLVFTWSAMAPA